MLRRGLAVSDAALHIRHRCTCVSVRNVEKQSTDWEMAYVHGDELHTLERERGLNDSRQNPEELVEMRLIRREVCAVQWARVFPVLFDVVITVSVNMSCVVPPHATNSSQSRPPSPLMSHPVTGTPNMF